MIELVERSVAEYEAMLRRWREGGAVLHCSFLHHCWVPNASTYTGRDTMLGVQRAHRQRPDVSDILCHVYTTPDGTVWPARPPTTWNCGCQAPTRPWAELPLSLRLLINATRGDLRWDRWPNAYGFSVETIGQFDRPTQEMPWSEDPTTSVAMKTSLDVLAEVHRIWRIPVGHCFFHRDVSHKSCPGNRVSREWVHAELRKRLEGEPVSDTVKIILGTGPEPEAVIDANAQVEDGTLRCGGHGKTSQPDVRHGSMKHESQRG